MTETAPARPRNPGGRQTNRRGEGERLRRELLAAAIEIVETTDLPLTLRGVARQVGVAATSVYLHFPDGDHLLAAVVELGFDQLTAATASAANGITDPGTELQMRCRAYCKFGLDHARLYRSMFDVRLPLRVWTAPDQTPGRRSFENLVAAVRRYQVALGASKAADPFRLASLIWTSMHGLVLARQARPTFPWAPVDDLVDEMVTRMMTYESLGLPKPGLS